MCFDDASSTRVEERPRDELSRPKKGAKSDTSGNPASVLDFHTGINCHSGPLHLQDSHRDGLGDTRDSSPRPLRYLNRHLRVFNY